MNKPLTKSEDDYHCPKCDLVMHPTPGTFWFRGKHFAGLVCVACNALYDNPEDSFWEAVKKIDDAS